ncbi:MAG: NUDIX domain-containing protein [Candidatus Yanofskybacteria bacterium]|nr:NUDIX domain-containing protein [Candidatus Yanofskybacteria bacterium]
MTEEYFDIVDQNDKLLGTKKPRTVVHQEMRDWHRATHIWIISRGEQILCQQRSLNKDSNPGQWQSFFGGHVQTGQTYEQAAKQELKEELGIELEVLRLLQPIYKIKNVPYKHHIMVYVLQWDAYIKDLSPNPQEIAELRWFSESGLKTSIEKGVFCNQFDKYIADFLQENLKKPAKKTDFPVLYEE